MNKAYKYTLTANEHKEITFDVGVNRLAISNANGTDGDITIVTSEITKTDSGEICSFVDGADAPFADFKVNIEAVQSGSGDPSPTNVRPITGWTGANIYNLQLPNGYHACDYVDLTNDRVELSVLDSYERNDLIVGVCFKVVNIPQYGTVYMSYVNESANATRLLASNNSANYFYVNNNTKASSSYLTPPVNAKNNFVYFQSYHDKLVYQNTDYNVVLIKGDTNTSNKMYIGHNNAQIQYKSFWIKTTSGTYITCLVPCIDPNGVSGFYDIVNNNFVTTSDPTKANAVGNFITPNILEFPSKATINWQSTAGTVYGGTLDVKAGVLTVTHANIASYDGEAINEPWISSMDVYTAGATPTTGAQVVYPLTTPVTYQLTPTEIRSLLGLNNVWADCGPVNVRYFVQSTQPMIDYIDETDEAVFDVTFSNNTYSLTDITAGNLYTYASTHDNVKLKLATAAGASEFFYLASSGAYYAYFINALFTTMPGSQTPVLYVRELHAAAGDSGSTLSVVEKNIS